MYVILFITPLLCLANEFDRIKNTMVCLHHHNHPSTLNNNPTYYSLDIRLTIDLNQLLTIMTCVKKVEKGRHPSDHFVTCIFRIDTLNNSFYNEQQ